MATARTTIESILLDRSWVSPTDLEKARQRRKPGQELAEVLVELSVGAIAPTDVGSAGTLVAVVAL